jgi:hypothetical protein
MLIVMSKEEGSGRNWTWRMIQMSVMTTKTVKMMMMRGDWRRVSRLWWRKRRSAGRMNCHPTTTTRRMLMTRRPTAVVAVAVVLAARTSSVDIPPTLMIHKNPRSVVAPVVKLDTDPLPHLHHKQLFPLLLLQHPQDQTQKNSPAAIPHRHRGEMVALSPHNDDRDGDVPLLPITLVSCPIVIPTGGAVVCKYSSINITAAAVGEGESSMSVPSNQVESSIHHHQHLQVSHPLLVVLTQTWSLVPTTRKMMRYPHSPLWEGLLLVHPLSIATSPREIHPPTTIIIIVRHPHIIMATIIMTIMILHPPPKIPKKIPQPHPSP